MTFVLVVVRQCRVIDAKSAQWVLFGASRACSKSIASCRYT